MGYLPLIDRYVAGTLNEIDEKMLQDLAVKNKASFVQTDSYNFESDFNTAEPGSTLIMPIRGSIMKESWCGDAGTAEFVNILQKALINSNISNAILIIDSPGGAVDGTFELADYIRDEFTKPITAFIDGMACSAGYAIASACDKVYASHATAHIGSIGVCSSFLDYSKRYEAMGIVEHYINADGSEDKNKAFFDAKGGDYKAMKESSLNPIRQIFVSTVKKNRPGVSETVFSGKVYMGEEAITLGLIDGIQTLEATINSTRLLSNSNSNYMFKIKEIAALKGLGADVITEDQVAAANRELQEIGVTGIELSIAGTVATNADQITNLQDEITALKNDVTAKDLTIEGLNTKVETLGKLLPESATSPIKSGADIVDHPEELSEVDKRIMEQAQAELSKTNL